MTDLKTGEVVRCHGRYIERFWNTPLKDALIGLAGIGGVTLVTWGHWIGKVLIFVMVCIYMIRRGRRSHEFFNVLPCPGCGQAVGGHFMKSFRVHLCCLYCGMESPTDCLFLGPGRPSKVD